MLDHLLELVTGTPETDITASLHNNIAEEYQYAGEFAQMLSAQERAVAVAERRQHHTALVAVLDNLAERAYYLGDWQRAREVDAHAAAILRELERYGAVGGEDSLVIRGVLALAEGHEDDGRRFLEQAIARGEEVSNAMVIMWATRALAEADLLAGQTEQARLCLAAVLQHPGVLQHPSVVGRTARSALPLLAWAEGALGHDEQAEARLAALPASTEPLIRVDALRVQGLLGTQQGRWALASEALDDALERTRAMPYPYAEAKTLWACGWLEAARGDPAAARKRFEQALAICDRLGERLYRAHIERALASLKDPEDPITSK
jgi:tetratricopeptide (TPR) repeat protein